MSKIGGFALGPIGSAIIGLITVPLITHFISPEEYGKASMFALAQGLITMFLYLGLDQAYAREAVNHKDDEERLVLNAMFLPMVLSIVLGVALVMFRRSVSVMLFDTPDEILAVILMAVMFPFIVLEHFALFKLRMEEKGLLYSVFTISLKVLILLFTVALFLCFERSFRSVVYATVFAEVANGTILWLLALGNVRFSFKKLDKEFSSQLLRFGLPLIPAVMLTWVLTSMDKVMLRMLCDYSELGLYAAAFKIVSALDVVQACFVSIWVPVAYRWYESGVSNERFSLVMKVIAVMMMGLCFVLLLCKTLFGWILGENFMAAVAIFPFLMLHPVMYTMSETTTLGISFQRKTAYNILISFVAALANILLNFALIPLWGSVGAAVATGISYLVFFWARTLISRRLWWDFPLGHYVAYSLLALVNCGAHTFMTGAFPYILSVVSLLIVVATRIPAFKEARRVLSETEQ
ncbi:MAG: polysaccharide biosynthesis protein [Firmicutes bacterium]|nr:polysaccharide biosynthesis protein [Bacillota bacterium]